MHYGPVPRSTVVRICSPLSSILGSPLLSHSCPDPSMPNAPEVQKALFHLEEDVLKPYELPPNRLSRDLYDNLPLPWTVDPLVSAFPRADFVRIEWDRDGILTNEKDFLAGDKETTLQGLEKSLGTASMVTRWREANPDLANTDKDCVKVAMRQVREALGIHADNKLKMGSSTTLLLFKRR